MPDEQPRGNFLTRKLGPLPVWAWLAIMTALALGYWWFFARPKSSSSPSATTGTPEVAVVEQNYATPPAAEPKKKAPDKDKDDDDKKKHRPTHHKTHHHTDREPVPVGTPGQAGGLGKGGGGDTGAPIRKRPPRGTHRLPDGRDVPDSVG